MHTLYTIANSPYGRKCWMLVLAADLADQVEVELIDLRNPPDGFHALSPLGKVPTLVTYAGVTIFDSPVICEFLDSLNPGPKLIPESGRLRWQALRMQALADGVMDASILVYHERKRDAAAHSQSWESRHLAAMNRGLDALERECIGFVGHMDIAVLATAAALGWVETGVVGPDWREGRARLTEWYDGFSHHDCMEKTAPPQGS